MKFIPVLAHGALGAFDELLLIAVALAFVIIMAISWLRTRNEPPLLEDSATPSTDNATPDQSDDSADRFKLD